MQKRCVFLLSALVTATTCIQVSGAQRHDLDPRDIFNASKSAVATVAAYTEDGKLHDTGTGFVIDPRGIVVTACHVVAPQPPAGQITTVPLNGQIDLHYYPTIRVIFPGKKPLDADPIPTHNSSESLVDDYAILRIRKGEITGLLPYLKLGEWNDVREGDDLATIGYSLGVPVPLLVRVSVSAKYAIIRPFKLNSSQLLSDALIFQGPANPGFSGGPAISDRTGEVVGIVTERLVGLGPELAKAKEQIEATRGRGGVLILGVDPNETTLALINVLDAFLSNGMGAALSIDHVKQEWYAISNAHP